MGRLYEFARKHCYDCQHCDLTPIPGQIYCQANQTLVALEARTPACDHYMDIPYQDIPAVPS